MALLLERVEFTDGGVDYVIIAYVEGQEYCTVASQGATVVARQSYDATELARCGGVAGAVSAMRDLLCQRSRPTLPIASLHTPDASRRDRSPTSSTR
jgi:hypothetical protein